MVVGSGVIVVSDEEIKGAYEQARLGVLELSDVMVLSDRLSAAGQRRVAIELYCIWIDMTPNALVYIGCFNCGVLMSSDGQSAQAEAMYRKALGLNSNFLQARMNLANCLEARGLADEALAQWRAALAFEEIAQPENRSLQLHALNNLGRLLEIERNYQDSLAALEESFAIDSTQKDVLLHLVHLRQKMCRWPIYNPPEGITREEMISGTSPLASVAAFDDPPLLLSIAKRFVAHKYSFETENMAPPGGYGHERIRVGYLSSDFCLHAVSLLTVQLFELHNHVNFEIYGFSWSREDGTSLRSRVISAMDQYIPIGQMGDREAAECIRSHEIDILIDLQGLTSGARPQILSYRPASVQITYLGYTGTTALPWIDYVISDNYLIPDELAPYFTEKPLYLPNCFQVSDTRREVAEKSHRVENNLPVDALVFCAFNNNYKFTPEMFTVWMNILKRVPHSVLWLLADNEWAQENMVKEAYIRGIDAQRLVFASRVAPPNYLARYQLADLFLDTFPFNGGTTANDALWMELPLLTCSGKTFSSRMAGSLLKNLGLTELITNSLAEYEERAVHLALSAGELAKIKNKLHHAKISSPVFDMPRITLDLENAVARALKEQIASFDEKKHIIETGETKVHEVLGLVSESKDAQRSLLVQGWTGINHSYAMVNQYQLLALSKDSSLELFQQEMPYFNQQWNKDKNGAGFTLTEQQIITQIKTYSGEAVSNILRVHFPTNLECSNAQILTFMITELGLSSSNFLSTPDIQSYQNNGNYIITSSRWSRDRIIDYGFSPAHVVVVPLGVDSTKYFPLSTSDRLQIRTNLGYKEDDVIFLNVGSPLWNKGMDLILKSFFKVRERHANARLIIKDQQELYGVSAHSMISNLASSGEITLDAAGMDSVKIIPSTLTIEQLRSLYSQSDYYLSPYRAEGFNLPVIEAIASGLKAIVTDGGSTDDFCNEMTSIKIPSRKHEHVVVQNTPISAYLDPDLDALIDIMGKCATEAKSNLKTFSFGRCDLIDTFTWTRTARMITSLFS